MIETPQDRLNILETHLQFLDAKRDNLFTNLGDLHPEFEAVLQEIAKTEGLKQGTLAAIANPRGHRVRVLKSRLIQEGAVGLVKYVYKDKPTAVVQFPGLEKPVALSKDNIEIVDLWPLPPWIPAPGMKVEFSAGHGSVSEHTRFALEWGSEEVKLSSRIHEDGLWVKRTAIVAINGQPV